MIETKADHNTKSILQKILKEFYTQWRKKRSSNYELGKNKPQKSMWAHEESTMSDTAIQQKSNGTEDDKE